MITIAFFNNKGGVGATSLVYHLAWMYADLGVKVVAADLDPQANLTAMFLEDDRLEALWPDGDHPLSISGAIKHIFQGIGDEGAPHVEHIADNIGLVVGDLGLSALEDELSDAWPRCLDGDKAAFRIISAFYRLLLHAARAREADVVLLDVGPNLGALNRAALIAAEHVVIPLAPDLASLQGLRNLGPALRGWRSVWQERLAKNPDRLLELPRGNMRPAGYVILQHAMRLDRPVRAYGRWTKRIPLEYRQAVLGESVPEMPDAAGDPHCLATLKHTRSLMPLALDARKPMFSLKPADGAIGAHMAAVHDCYLDFKGLAVGIAQRCGISLV